MADSSQSQPGTESASTVPAQVSSEKESSNSLPSSQPSSQPVSAEPTSPQSPNAPPKPRKRPIVINPKVDFVLTVLYWSLVVYGFVLLIRDPFFLTMYLVMLPVTVGWIYSTRSLFHKLGKWVSESYLNEPRSVAKNPLRNRLTMKKWKDQGWQLMIHVSMTLFELYIFYFDVPIWDQPEIVFNPVPQHSDIWPISLKLLYVVQLAVWVVTCYSHRYLEARRKDYLQMYAHHILTIALVLGSWSFAYFKIGLIVFYIHDVSDIFIDLLKLSNYLKVEGPSNFFLTEIAYTSSLVFWAYYRFYQLAVRVLYTTFIVTHKQQVPDATAGKPWLTPWHEKLPWYVEANLLLLGLLTLHVYWFFLLARIGVRMVLGVKPSGAGKEEYEGDSSDPDRED